MRPIEAPPEPLLRALSLLVALLLLAAGALAADPARRSFDLPGDAAEAALRRFATQAEREILFSVDSVSGVRTRTVQGVFVPTQALSLMLADTALCFFEDETTGGFIIGKASGPTGSAAAPNNPTSKISAPRQSPEPVMSKKRRNPLALLVGWLALAVAPESHGQAADPSIHNAAARGDVTLTGRVLNVASGNYLNNARVSVRGTNLQAFTDETGTYLLRQVPAGRVMIDVFYTGMAPQSVALDAAPGQTLTRDVDLLAADRAADSQIIQLEAFTVSTERETDGQAIAVNEQRFAPNIKNVVATDLMGDVMDGNVGEFLKFLPGIVADYDNEDGSTIAYVSVRGLSSSMATVSTDGAKMASSSNTYGDTRQFSFNSVSINNISRIEVTKVPAPSDPADSLAGSVNMVSKSAFERKSSQLRYNLQLTGNNENLTFHRQPHTNDRKIQKILPSANFDYTLPLTPRFGIVVTGLSSRRFTKQHRSQTTYENAGTSTGASAANPYLRAYTMFNSPRTIARDSMGLSADWRVTQHGVLSVGGQWSHYESERYATQFVINAGSSGTPTPASGTPLSFGPDFTNGATGRGSVTMGGAASVRPDNTTRSASLRFRHNDGRWRIETGANYSSSLGRIAGTESDTFRQMGITSRGALRVNFRGTDPVRPTQIEIFDSANQPWDMNNALNYNISSANSTPRTSKDEVGAVRLKARRALDFLDIPAGLEVGADIRNQTRDVRRENITWTYQGINGDKSALPFVSPMDANRDNAYGFAAFPYVSPHLACLAYKDNPALFTKTASQLVTEETFRINNSLYFEERVSSAYLQSDTSLFRGRLKALFGVRCERTDVEGLGPLVDAAAVWMRAADGSFAHDAAGARIRRSEAGTANSIEQLRLTHTERGAHSERSYQGSYPSVHLSYSLTPNLILRAAYARTYGRPNITDIVPQTRIEDFDVEDPSAVQGEITITNPGLKPWTAHNYDLSLEYYTDKGGLFSAGVFQKDIADFFNETVFIATLADTQRLDLDPSYEGWRVSTRVNGGDARIRGAEFNLRHSLAPLGNWGRAVTVFVNGTKLELDGDQKAAFNGFVPKTLNWGITLSKKPFVLMAKWNHRGIQRNGASPSVSPDAFTYQKARTALDINFEMQLHRRIALFFNAQNVFNAPYITEIYGSQTPAYARRSFTNHNGVGLTMGIKGTF